MVELSDEVVVEQIIKATLEVNHGGELVLAIPIIGIRTATNVAQRIYHDKDVQYHFDVKHWVCMFDCVHDHSSKLLDLLFRQQAYNDEILEEFHSVVDGKRYLLVLDGVMHDDLGFLLSDLLCNVSLGSKVILTAPSDITIGNVDPLSMPDGAPFNVAAKDQQTPQEAWALFRKIAFEDGEKEKDKGMFDIGVNICIKYDNFPCLLKLIASFLSSKKTVQEWEDAHNKLPTSLKYSLVSNLSKFNHEELLSNILQCGMYCSLFPENYLFDKTELIHLWTAQENLLTAKEKPEELVGEDYFAELHNNHFFENSSVRNNGTTMLSYKMQYFVTELLKDFAKPEFRLFSDGEDISYYGGADIRHVSISVNSSWEAPSWLANSKTLQSLLFLPSKPYDQAYIPNLSEILKGLTCLRALNLAAVNCEKLLRSFGEHLKDLRYLKLGISSKCLSDSIIKLKNLQTLDLRQSGIISLPKDFHKLKNLRHLYTGGKLIDMPPNFGELKGLQTLDVFVVRSKKGLDELIGMNDLAGKLTICFKMQSNLAITPKMFKDMNLTDLSLVWSEANASYDGSFSSLEPPPGLKSITICHWKGKEFPNKLISAKNIEDCTGYKDLKGLSTLPHLKSLQLWYLKDLEYIEASGDDASTSTSSTSSSVSKHCFPSLEYVILADLPALVSWSSPKSQQLQHPIHSERLSLCVSRCKKMILLPLMRSLVSLVADEIHGTLLKQLLSTSSGQSPSATLRKLEITSITRLDQTLSISKLNVLESLSIKRCPELTKLVLGSLFSLKRLEIHECDNLEHITCAQAQLPSVETLEIKHCEKLALIKDSRTRDWECFNNLRFLKLINILNLKSLEIGLCSLEKLEELSLYSIYELRVLHDWIGNIKQLHQLAIRKCPFLLTLPESLGKLAMLQKLQLHCCPKLKQLPNSVLSNSQLLKDIQQCPKLQEAICKQPNGDDFPRA
ncbi:putative disease resistance protein RGA4 [Bienertia sinuspersici]